MKFCSNCGQQLGEGHKFCSGCGQPISTSGPSRQATKTDAKTIGIVLVLIGVAVAGSSFYLFQTATHALSQGDILYGMGWLFSDRSREEVSAFQATGVGGMIFGVVLLIVGLVHSLRTH